MPDQHEANLALMREASARSAKYRDATYAHARIGRKMRGSGWSLAHAAWDLAKSESKHAYGFDTSFLDEGLGAALDEVWDRAIACEGSRVGHVPAARELEKLRVAVRTLESKLHRYGQALRARRTGDARTAAGADQLLMALPIIVGKAIEGVRTQQGRVGHGGTAQFNITIRANL